MSEQNTSKKSVLLVATFAAFLTPFLGSAVNLALPAIGKDLHANAIQLGWVISSFILSSAIFLLPFGRLADITGRKKIFSLGILLFTISTLLIIFSRSITSLIILRVFQGLSSSMIYGTSLAIITSVFQPGERGRAMGINITATILAPADRIGGLLTQYLGWRSILFLVPLVCFTSSYHGKLKPNGQMHQVKILTGGICHLWNALSSFMFGFSRSLHIGWILFHRL